MLNLKSGLLLLAIGSLSACGGSGTITVEFAQEKLSAFTDEHIDISPFDANGDSVLQGEELVSIWNSLTEEQQYTVTGALGINHNALAIEIETGAYVNWTAEGNPFANLGGIYKLNSDLNIGAALFNNITGYGVDILVADNFNSDSTHGTTVEGIIENIAWDSNVTRYNIEDQYAEEPDFNDYDLINLSYEVEWTADEAAEITNIWNGLEGDPLVVIAAGNQSADCLTVETCNGFAVVGHNSNKNTIIVGALNDEGTALEDYSNKAGILMDSFITAPVSNYGYWTGNLDGTSFAAPYLTGVAALIMEKYDSTDASTARNIIFETADDIGAPGVDAVYGHGRLNVGRALSPLGELN